MQTFIRCLIAVSALSISSFCFALQNPEKQELKIVDAQFQISNSDGYVMDARQQGISSKPMLVSSFSFNTLNDDGGVRISNGINLLMLPVVKDGFIYLTIHINKQVIPLFLKSGEERTVNFCINSHDCNYKMRLKISV